MLIGDVTHDIVPFYGQGMNAGFEDCRIFNELTIKYNSDWKKIYPEFTNVRKENTDAIADLALENFIEMRDKVADSQFMLIKKAEHILSERFPDIISKYSLITFNPDIPYWVARKNGDILLDLVAKYCKNINSISDFEFDLRYESVMKVYENLD